VYRYIEGGANAAVVPEVFNGVGEAVNEEDLGVVFRRGILVGLYKLNPADP
jgi:hypothetical protein